MVVPRRLAWCEFCATAVVRDAQDHDVHELQGRARIMHKLRAGVSWAVRAER
jgi:hypothetical protein